VRPDAAAPRTVATPAAGTGEETVLHVLALDSSPQATTLLLLSAAGAIPPFDLAIYADRTSDRPRIFAQLARAQQIAQKAGTPILRITSESAPIDATRTKILQILGHQQPRPVPTHVVAELAIGVCLDDIHNATEPDVPYLRYVFPLLELGWSRRDCDGYLRSLQADRNGPERWRRGWAL
jgi:hypothetical protein